MKTSNNFIWSTVIAMTILIGIGATGRLASAQDCIPTSGATVVSATFTICVENDQQSIGDVNLHRITDDWDEMTVTWNSFGGNYDGAIRGSFNPDGAGCYDVDVTALVQDWVNATYENFGMLLKVTTLDDSVIFWSKESPDPTLHPELEICFASGCITLQNPADAYIDSREQYADTNTGSGNLLYTRLRNTFQKQSLVRFESCLWTRTPGFWKNHPDVIDDPESCWNGGVSLLDIDVCGVTLTDTAPEILGGSRFSTSEAMSGPMGGWVTQLQLARQCTAAALNQAAMEAAGGSYGETVDQLIDECCGDGGFCGGEATSWEIGFCVNNLNSFNNSGDEVMNTPFEGCYRGDSTESRAAAQTATTIFTP